MQGRSVKCFYTNANSVISKMDELRERVKGCNLVGIMESWATNNISDAELHIEGMTMFRSDRKSGIGGGVILYVDESLNASLCHPVMNSEFDDSVWCIVNTAAKEKILFGVCYRSTASNDVNNENLLQLLDKVANIKGISHILLMGDFNYPEIDYTTATSSSSDRSHASRFLKKTQDNFLVQNVFEPTRYRPNCNPSNLDYVFASEENLVEDLKYEAPIGKSDHVCLTWKFVLEAVQQEGNGTRQFNYWKGDYTSISRELEQVDWNSVLGTSSVEDSWLFLKSHLTALMDKYIPRKKVRNKKNKSNWMSAETMNMLKMRNQAWKKFQIYRSIGNYNAYKKIRNKVNRMVRVDQKNHRRKTISSFKDKPKKFYSYMRQTQTVKIQVSQLEKEDGTMTESDKEAADELCRFFKSVFIEDNDLAPSEAKIQQHQFPTFVSPMLCFSRDSVLKKLTGLHSDKSPGPDEVHPMLLKECAEVLAEPLSLIFQQSFESGCLPEDWKSANVVPIFKKGRRGDVSNYRPVSLTSVPCKVMESLLKDDLTKYLESTSMLSKVQHGFCQGRSCLTNLLETFEAWTLAVDQGYGIDVVYLDYRKAFDTVWHNGLLTKLQGYGVGGQLLAWIKSFLQGRRMRVQVRGAHSDWVEVSSGVPQGSVLGPLLFLIFVNDIPEWIKSNVKMFADDTKVWTRISRLKDGEVLQDDLNNLMSWSDKWKLGFNAEKCKVMHIGHSYETKYRMNVQGTVWELAETKEERDLGIIVTSNLKPSQQCIKAASKARSILGWINRHFGLLNIDEFKILYKTYVRPHMEFCVQAWSPYLQKDIKCLERIQRRATKMVHGLKDIAYDDRLEILGLISLEDRRLRGDLIEVFKILTDRENIDKYQFFTPSACSHLRGHSLKLSKPRSTRQVRQNFFSQRVIDVWNKLPSNVVTSTSVNMFNLRTDWMTTGTT